MEAAVGRRRPGRHAHEAGGTSVRGSQRRASREDAAATNSTRAHGGHTTPAPPIHAFCVSREPTAPRRPCTGSTETLAGLEPSTLLPLHQRPNPAKIPEKLKPWPRATASMLTPTDEKYRNYSREELSEADSRISWYTLDTSRHVASKIHGSDTGRI